jgi:hypothetical protein
VMSFQEGEDGGERQAAFRNIFVLAYGERIAVTGSTRAARAASAMSAPLAVQRTLRRPRQRKICRGKRGMRALPTTRCLPSEP